MEQLEPRRSLSPASAVCEFNLDAAFCYVKMFIANNKILALSMFRKFMTTHIVLRMDTIKCVGVSKLNTAIHLFVLSAKANNVA